MLAGHPKPPTAGPVVMGDGRSSYTRAVRIAFFEKGDRAHAASRCSRNRRNSRASIRSGRSRCLRLGEASLYESSAILRYIDEVYPGPALMPTDPLARAKAEQWISAINCYADRAIVRKYVLQYVFPRGADGKPDRAAIEAAIPEIRKVLAALDAAYGASDYLVGNEVEPARHPAGAGACNYLGAVSRGQGAHCRTTPT